ncbi:MAG TPA: GtrA family protein [Allosphingosinicella sp.]|nr:GtrA family protein [Allosphingosinicella sp.]
MKLIEKHREIVGQLIRFALTGGLLTVLVAGGYWFVATILGVEPMLSLTLNFVVFTGLGYVLHSRISFRGHGSRGNATARTARFFTVNVIGFLTNQFFVWLLVKQLGGPTWWPVLPILFVTPLLTFALNRRWVFA